VSFAEQDVPGTYFYWSSKTTPLGAGGQVWSKTFGDSTAARNVTSGPFSGALCAGCHAVARDGSRMVVYAIDDTDADYGGLAGSFLDLTTLPDSGQASVVGGAGSSAIGGTPAIPPGWASIVTPDYPIVTSNGVPCAGLAMPCGGTNGYDLTVPGGAFVVGGGNTGGFGFPLSVVAPDKRPTMPDLSAGGHSLVFVVPSAIGSWDNGRSNDDDHVFGGSIFTAPFSATTTTSTSSVLVQSAGENNYYPTFSPDLAGSFVLFDRAPLDSSVATVTGCTGTPPQAVCPNDSFSNPTARVMLVSAQGGTPLDLQAANGSPSSLKLPLSNSYPRWAPTIASYKGKKLYWITFSSTRNYGLRVNNQKADYHPCYPPDSLEWPGSTHHATMSAQCQQPQLWMAPILVDASGSISTDPSGVAFWIPQQDITTHNHMATWSQ
jgi:hypothetical protein